MPQVLRIGSYIIYFWSNENNPLEPIHVHIAEGQPYANATKLWITSTGKILICHNNSMISEKILRKIIRILEANRDEIINAWLERFGEIKYFC
ncbi:MAG: DUF4160 domain-containing protein [Synergistaceae bacterium]|nr:DUF4160 domain-containing protein [Synergistaceae bacterium]